VLGMITIGVLGLMCSGLIRFIGKAMMPWLTYGARAGSNP
jgi:NitT/TauT family transport system permease protein